MSTTSSVPLRLSLALAALCIGLAATPLASRAASTSAQASTSAAIGLDGDGDHVVAGPAATATSVNGHTLFTQPGIGSVDSRLEVRSEYGALHARATVQTAAPYSQGVAGSSSGGDPDTAAYFDDQITVGGAGGPQVFKLYYTLTGSAGQTGSAEMQFAADLSLQVSGFGVHVTDASPAATGFFDTYTVAVSGSGPRVFSESGYAEITADSGSTFTLYGYLGAWLRLSEPGDTAAPSTATLDLWHTGSFHIVAAQPGTTFTSASGFDYLAVSTVPEPAPLAMMALALPLLGGVLRRQHQRAAQG